MSLPSGLAARLGVLLAAACSLGAPRGSAAETLPRRITVEAGPQTRHHTPVSFPFRPPAGRDRWFLAGPNGTQLPVQLDRAAGVAWFLEPNLPAGTTNTYRLRAGRTRRPPSTVAPTVTRHGQAITLGNGERPVLTFIAGPGRFPRPNIRPEYLRGGYLHPLRTPSGRIVTDDYPTNHVHHHGVWASWTRTRFEGRSPDFWNMGDRKGRTDFESLESTAQGPVFAELRATMLYTDLLAVPPRPALREQWTVRVFRSQPGSPAHLVDLESRQTCVGPATIEFPKYHYGGLAYRGPMAWNGPGAAASYLDSNGTTDRTRGNESTVRWFWLGGAVGGAVAGLVQLGHPGNFRAPQPVRIHPTEPYSCWTPAQAGDWAIRPGDRHESRYRFLVLDGEPDRSRMDAAWSDFAEPPRVRVE